MIIIILFSTFIILLYMLTKIISFLFIIIIIIYCIYIGRNCTTTKIFELDSNKPGPTILIVAGTHGNEPAASYYFTNLVNSTFKPNRGKMIIIPRVNDCALKLNMRSVPLLGDINRKYYISNNVNSGVNRVNGETNRINGETNRINGETNRINGGINRVNGGINRVNGETNRINKQIIDIINSNRIDFVLDFHEGYDFHKINVKSFGSTISYTYDKTGKAKKYGENIVEKINETIIDEKKKFTLLDPNYKPIKGTLLSLLSELKISGILIETSGQNNIQPLQKRLEQIELIFNIFL